MERDIQYENSNIGFDEQYPEEEGGGIKCKNYILCEAVLPKRWFECKGNYLCTNCDVMFGKVLDISDNTECPICLETKLSISQPNCSHTLCIDCFKRCHYGDRSGEPKFPYPDIEDEYYDDQENPLWNIQYPLIKKHHEEWNKWDDDTQAKLENEKNLRCCPICRIE